MAPTATMLYQPNIGSTFSVTRNNDYNSRLGNSTFGQSTYGHPHQSSNYYQQYFPIEQNCGESFSVSL